MKTIELRHNPFRAETVISVDGREIHLSCIGTGEGSHIQEWKNSVFSQIIKKINIGPGSPCAVVFFGVEEDYSLLKQSWELYCMENKDVKVYFEYGTKPPVTLASKEIEIRDLTGKYIKESPCDVLRSADVFSKIESINDMDFPEYLEKAEKLCRQTNEYVKLIESLHLRDEAEQQLTGKNAELDELNADMEERRRLEAENVGIQFEEAAAILENDIKKEIERFLKDTLSETNTKIDALLSEITDKINKYEISYISFASERETIKDSLIKLINEKINTLIEVPLKIYKNAFSSFVFLIDKPVIKPFDRKNIMEFITENNEAAESSGKINVASDFSLVLANTFLFPVGGNELLKKEMMPLFDNAKKYFAEVSEKVRTYYQAEIDKIIDVLKKQGNEEKEKQKKALKLILDANDETKNKLETEIMAIQNRKKWIDDFEIRLNNIFKL
jgi:hypothetical protein